MKLKFLLIIATLILFGTSVNAESSTSILVNVLPPNPAPYEDTSITLNSYTYNLDSVLISWSLDGKTIASGTGKKSLSITAPAPGRETNVVATIYLPDGAVETKMTIRSSVMVLLFQATDSYVPPFYKGKAMPTPDSEIKIVAMPEIRTGSGLIDSKNLTYVWKKDYTNSQENSGYGKNSFTYTSDYLENSNNVSVSASTVDQKYSSQGSIDVGATQPKILFYKNDKALGTIWEKTLPNPYKIQGPEIVEAIPYFISPKEMQNPALLWSWFINDNRVDMLGFKKNLMPLQVAEGTHGTSVLRLNIENQEKIFQTTSKEINIEF